jgi:hypothetical protein
MPKKTPDFPLTAKALEEKFDNGGDTDADFDWAAAQRPAWGKQTRIQLNVPVWMLQRLDEEARRVGVPRQSVITMWLADRLGASGGV